MSYLHLTLSYHTLKTFYDPMLSYFLLKLDHNEKLANHEKSGVGGVGNKKSSGVGNGVGEKKPHACAQTRVRRRIFSLFHDGGVSSHEINHKKYILLFVSH